MHGSLWTRPGYPPGASPAADQGNSWRHGQAAHTRSISSTGDSYPHLLSMQLVYVWCTGLLPSSVALRTTPYCIGLGDMNPSHARWVWEVPFLSSLALNSSLHSGGLRIQFSVVTCGTPLMSGYTGRESCTTDPS